MPPIEYLHVDSGDTYIVRFSDNGELVECDRHMRHAQTNNLIRYAKLSEIEPPEAQKVIRKLVKEQRIVWVW